MKEEKTQLAEEIRQMKEELELLKSKKNKVESENAEVSTEESIGEAAEEPAEYGWYNPVGWFASANEEPE